MMSSPILRSAMGFILPLTLIIAMHVAFKGHNAPGGGFIAGLMIAVGVALLRFTFGTETLDRFVPCHPRTLVTIGLLLACGSAVGPMVAGHPMLTSANFYIDMPFIKAPHFSTVMIFDIGVMAVVAGVCVGMIDRLLTEEALEQGEAS